MVDPITGIDTEQAKLADVVNRQNVGTSQRFRNEQIRKQTQSGQSPDLSSLYSTTDVQNSNTPSIDMWSSIDKSLFGDGTYRGHTIENTYDSAVQNAKKYSSYGFVPNSSPTGFEYSTPEWSGYKAKAPDGFMRWTHGNYGDTGSYGLDYDPMHGYKEWRNVGSAGDAEGVALVGSVIGSVLAPGLGITAFGPKSISGIDFGSKLLNSGANSALKSFVSSGGDINSTFKGAALGGLTSGISEWLGKNPVESLGPIGNKVLGGAASGALSSLFTKNNPVVGSLYGGMSGGLNAYLNSVSKDTDVFNKLVSSTSSGLLKKHLFGNK